MKYEKGQTIIIHSLNALGIIVAPEVEAPAHKGDKPIQSSMWYTIRYHDQYGRPVLRSFNVKDISPVYGASIDDEVAMKNGGKCPDCG